MLHLVTMTALRPLAGEYLDNRHPNEGESFRTDNFTAEQLERQGLACRYYAPVLPPLAKVTMPAFRVAVPAAPAPVPPLPPPAPVETVCVPIPILAVPVPAPAVPPAVVQVEKMYTPSVLAAGGKMLHVPENKMLRIDGNKVLPLPPPRSVSEKADRGLVKKRGRGRPPGSKNKPKR